jgi:hypothetical protein
MGFLAPEKQERFSCGARVSVSAEDLPNHRVQNWPLVVPALAWVSEAKVPRPNWFVSGHGLQPCRQELISYWL